jgi:signal transduction histidine kinase
VDSTTLWTYSLIAAVAVILIVASLLILIIVTARSIDKNARNIWTVGKTIAANTVSIWLLQETNQVARQILSGAGAIVKTASSIDDKLGQVAGRLS